MKTLISLSLIFALLLCGCGSYVPAGSALEDTALEAQVVEILQETCKKDNTLAENVGLIYDWVADEIQYRASTADLSEGFTEEVTNQLAAELLAKRRGACDGQAALMCVFLRRMGCESVIVEGQFVREDGNLVDHAWVITQIDGSWYHVDPLYGRYYAGDAIRSYCMADDAFLEATHQWDRAAYPVCD